MQEGWRGLCSELSLAVFVHMCLGGDSVRPSEPGKEFTAKEFMIFQGTDLLPTTP